MVWSGYGVIVPIFTFATFVLVQLAVDTVLGEEYYVDNAWPMRLAVGLAAALLALCGYYFNHVRRPMLYDEETGVPLGKGQIHTFFFIPIEYWSLIVAFFFLVMGPNLAD